MNARDIARLTAQNLFDFLQEHLLTLGAHAVLLKLLLVFLEEDLQRCHALIVSELLVGAPKYELAQSLRIAQFLRVLEEEMHRRLTALILSVQIGTEANKPGAREGRLLITREMQRRVALVVRFLNRSTMLISQIGQYVAIIVEGGLVHNRKAKLVLFGHVGSAFLD